MLYFTIGLACLYCICHAAPQQRNGHAIELGNGGPQRSDHVAGHSGFGSSVISFKPSPINKRIVSRRDEIPTFISFPDEQIANCALNIIVFADTKNLDENNECLPKNGGIPFEGECHKILKQGPCPDQHWVILTRKCQPECAKRNCPLNKLFYNNKCVDATSDGVCKPREILYVEYTGETYCDCETGLAFDKSTGHCIEEHIRGSCPFGQYIELDDAGNLHCKVNPCKHEHLILNPNDGSCYVKEFPGRCRREENLTFHHDGTATCPSVDIRNIFEVPTLNSCPAGSKKDHLNNCRVLLRSQPRNPFAFRIPTQYVHRDGYCPENFVIYPNRTCKKPNALFRG